MTSKIFFYLPVIIILIFGFGCNRSDDKKSSGSNLNDSIQSVKILEKRTLTKVSDGHFQNPLFSSNSKRIFFTSSNYNGIYYYDLDKKAMLTLTTDIGSGYHFTVSNDGKKIYYRAEAPKVKKRRRFMLFEQDVENGDKKKLLNKSVRNLSPPQIINEKVLSYSVDDNPKLLNIDRVQEETISKPNVPFYNIVKNQLLMYRPGTEVFKIGFENRSLLWPDLNPTGDRMLIYVSGKGLHLIDSSAKDSRYLGDFRAAKWSPYKNIIVYMRDIDDGERITGSDIYTFNLQDGKTINLTQTTDVIEMYPDWSLDGKMICYHTNKGQIEILELSLK